ncbi:MAG: YicC/YloC family endoribonuclease [Oscillospiraceae bacterium]|jgi:uncharacterized protein (TIGR00255 family)
MIKSMTGYGRAEKSFGERKITVEMKSVNNRYLDCTVKLPRLYLFAEEAVKSRVREAISRGKLDVFVTISETGAKNISISLNRPLLEGYLEAFRVMSEDYGIKGEPTVSEIARLPDVLRAEEQEEDYEELQREIIEVTGEALDRFDAMRINEGRKLLEDIEGRLEAIDSIALIIEKRSPVTIEEYRQRLEAKMREVLESSDIDENRILLEAAIFADRVAVNEELVRLRSHLSQLRQMLRDGGAVGRKLDFLIQEMNREVNTIGSKGNDLPMSHAVIELKAEIEKIREQAQNIE